MPDAQGERDTTESPSKSPCLVDAAVDEEVDASRGVAGFRGFRA